MVPHRVYLYIILESGTPQNVPRHLPMFKLFLCSIRRIFLKVSLRTAIIINVGSSSAAVYFLLQEEYTSFWQMIPRRVYLYVSLANGTPQRVPRLAPTFTRFFMSHGAHFFFCPIVFSYYFQRCSIECECLSLLLIE